MTPSSIAFLVLGLLVGLMAFIGLLSAVKGTPVDLVQQFGTDSPLPWTSRASAGRSSW